MTWRPVWPASGSAVRLAGPRRTGKVMLGFVIDGSLTAMIGRRARQWCGGAAAGIRGLGVVLVLVWSGAAAQAGPAAQRCLLAMEGLPAERAVSPAERCPALIEALGGSAPDRWTAEPVPARALRTLARSMLPAERPLIRVDPEQLQRIVDATYLPAVPPWLQRLREWLTPEQPQASEPPAWARALVDWVQANSGWLRPLFEGLLVLTVVVLIGWIVLGLPRPRLRWRWVRGRRGGTAPQAPPAAARQRLEDIAGLAPAAQVPAALAWVIEQWARGGDLPRARRMTNGQIRRHLAGRDPDRAEAFAALARAAEAALYGGRQPDDAQRSRCLRLARELGGQG